MAGSPSGTGSSRQRSMPARARRTWTGRPTGDDQGLTLVELLVAMAIFAVVVTVAVKVIVAATDATMRFQRNSAMWSRILDANTQILNDVTDGSTITVAEANQLSIQVVRNDKCQLRTWNADTAAQTLEVTTVAFEQAQCTGPSTTATQRFIGLNAVGKTATANGTHPTQYLSTATFAYYDSFSDTPQEFPVDPDRVMRVGWTLTARVDDGYNPKTMTSAQTFTKRGAVASGNGDIIDPKTPLLCNAIRLVAQGATCGTQAPTSAATGKIEGVDHPIVQWVDNSPAGLTSGWTVMRRANPEGMNDTAPGYTGWQYVLIMPANITTYTDIGLPAGYTATYMVIASNNGGGVGPNSNTVVTGTRPAAPTLTAIGAATSITLTWTRPTGTTAGYDLYRDGILAGQITDPAITTWTDGPGQYGWTGTGYNHAHSYQVVAVNRWEAALTTGSQTGRLALGATATTVYGGATRALSSAATAYTAPAAASLAGAANTDRTTGLTWTPQAWIGTGPVPTVTWHVTYRSSTEGAGDVWAGTASSWTHGARPAGRWSEYQVYGTDGSGTGPGSGWARFWQRPDTPSCSIAGATTRSLTVAAGLGATADESYPTLYVRDAGSNDWQSNGFTFDPLVDGGHYGYRVYTTGAGGVSDQGYCDGWTPVLPTPGPPGCSANVNDGEAPGVITVAGGDQVKLGSGGTVHSSPRTFSALSAGTYYGYARSINSDGYNTKYGGWAGCGGGTIVNPTPAIPAGYSTAGPHAGCGAGNGDVSTIFQANYSASYYTPNPWVVYWADQASNSPKWLVQAVRKDSNFTDNLTGSVVCGGGTGW